MTLYATVTDGNSTSPSNESLDDATYYKLVDVAGVEGCVDTQVSAATAKHFGGKLGDCASQAS